MTEFIQNPLWFYLLIANLYLFGLMGYDKYQAVRKNGVSLNGICCLWD